MPEPLGGAHRDSGQAASTLKSVLLKHLKDLRKLSVEDLLERRYQKYRSIGLFEVAQAKKLKPSRKKNSKSGTRE